MKRIILYNKDLQLLTGKSERTCYQLMKKIRLKFGKETGVPITIHEVSDYLRTRPDIIRTSLYNRK